MPGAVVGKFRSPGAHGDDDVGGLIEEFVAFGQDADDGVGVAIEGDGTAEDLGGAGIFALPQAVAEERDGGRRRLVVRGDDSAPERDVDAEKIEEVAADHLAGDLFGFIGAGEGHGEDAGCAKFFERGALSFPVAEILPGDGQDGKLPGALGDQNDAVGIPEGEGAEEDGVEDAEDGGGASDAESEGEDCDGSKGLSAAQLTDGELQVSKQAQEHLAGGADDVCVAIGIRLFAQVSHRAGGRQRIFGMR